MLWTTINTIHHRHWLRNISGPNCVPLCDDHVTFSLLGTDQTGVHLCLSELHDSDNSGESNCSQKSDSTMQRPKFTAGLPPTASSAAAAVYCVGAAESTAWNKFTKSAENPCTKTQEEIHRCMPNSKCDFSTEKASSRSRSNEQWLTRGKWNLREG